MLAKGSEYSLHSYKGVGGYAIFKHKCGLLINKKIHPFLNMDKVTPRSNKHLTDCPACAKSISSGIVDLKHWTSLVTNQQLALLDLKPTFLCRCGNEFQTGFEIILSQKHHGCAECYKKTSQEKRYFHFNKLREIVSKRGFILSPPLPKTYNCNLHVKRTGENHEYPNTLSFLQQFPASKDGFNPKFEVKKLAYGRFAVNDECFSEESIESAFWAGFIAADGWVDGDKRIGLSQHINNEPILIDFAKYLDFGNTLSYRISASNAVMVELRFTSKVIAKSLKQFGIVRRKSLTLSPPKFSQSTNVLAFIAGYIEGDGWVRKYYQRNNKCFCIGLCSGSKQFIEWAHNEIKSQLGITGSFSTNQNTVSLKYSNSASITLLERLYPVSNQNSKITKAYSELASITGHDKLEISS
ncbi:LAGLIDADG family homing endonuclease [Pseudoalteromonas lipolytica]|uniref:LAGLIDADG family homing endonuclease n=1 Tax=Pseudoalteromonas lipolytica TaxID=570156 RepID=A0ABU8SY81_9GAMM